MIWLTWRQFRVQALALLIPLVALAVALIWTEPGLAHLYSANGLNRCAVPGDCGQRTTAFLTAVQSSKYPLGYFVGGAVLYLFPAVIGAFWGAPLISRELEAGTFRLAWNQSVTRTRWTLVKLALVGLTAMAIAALASVLVTWWAAPVDAAGGFPGRPRPARPVLPAGFRGSRPGPHRVRRLDVHHRRAGRGAGPQDHPGHGNHTRAVRRAPVRAARVRAPPSGHAGHPGRPGDTGPDPGPGTALRGGHSR